MIDLEMLQSDNVKKTLQIIDPFKNILAIVGIIALSVIIAFSINTSWKGQKLRMQKQIKELEKKKKIVASMNKMKYDLESFKSELMDDDFFELKSAIERIAKDANLRVESLKPGREVDKELYKEMEVLLTTKGEYSRLVRFAELLSRTPLPLEIARLQINLRSYSRRATDGGLTIDLRISGITKK